MSKFKLKELGEFVLANSHVIKNPQTEKYVLDTARKASNNIYLDSYHLKFLLDAKKYINQEMDKEKKLNDYLASLTLEERLWQKYAHEEWRTDEGPSSSMDHTSFMMALSEYGMDFIKDILPFVKSHCDEYGNDHTMEWIKRVELKLAEDKIP